MISLGNTLLLGCGIFSLFVAGYILSWIVQFIVAWIDDGKVKGSCNWFVDKVNVLPWKYEKSFGFYDNCYRSEKSNIDRFDFFFITFGTWLGISFVLPLFCLFTYHFYPITIGIGITIGVLYLTRFVVRLKKKLNIHVENKNAHKGD